MSRTERKLRQALAEIDALRTDLPKMQESLTMLTNQNFEMGSALREAEVVIVNLRKEGMAALTGGLVTIDFNAPWKRVSALDFLLAQIRSALGKG